MGCGRSPLGPLAGPAGADLVGGGARDLAGLLLIQAGVRIVVWTASGASPITADTWGEGLPGLVWLPWGVALCVATYAYWLVQLDCPYGQQWFVGQAMSTRFGLHPVPRYSLTVPVDTNSDQPAIRESHARQP